MPNREGSENRKNYLYENEVKSPVLFFNGQSATKPRTGERSTTIPDGSRYKRIEAVSPYNLLLIIKY